MLKYGATIARLRVSKKEIKKNNIMSIKKIFFLFPRIYKIFSK
jgi:hypothetical protein